jgi:hypothetical protein
VREAAYRLDQPLDSTINGGGIKFAGPNSPDPGQNLRAPSVVGQWQSVGVMRTVYPAGFVEARPIIPGH